jgi:putative transposase
MIEDSRLMLSKIGSIKIKQHRPIDGKIKTCTVKREAGYWYVFFSCEVEPALLPPSDECIGIDVGLKSFATLSDGFEVENPRHYHKAQDKLRIAQRKVSRRNKRSNRRRKAVVLLQRAHAHIRNQRSDFHHKLARLLVNQYGFIAIENLNIQGLASGMLAKSVTDAGWSSFIAKLSYKAAEAGRQLIEVDPRGTSQTCTCGHLVPKTLRDRWHECPVCGLSADRDHVSAQVILYRARTGPSGRNVEEVISCVSREATAFRFGE